MASITFQNIVEHRPITPQIQQALTSFNSNPDLYLVRINLYENKAYLLKMSPEWYQKAIFLDPARVNGTCAIETDLSWLRLQLENIPLLKTPAIYHSAFCGSTLMSKALDNIYQCLSLREPETLASIMTYVAWPHASDLDKQFWFESVMKLLSRRYAPDQPAVIKANDNSNPLLIEPSLWQQNNPILFMYTPLEEFVAGCMKAPNRLTWIRDRYVFALPKASGLLNFDPNFSLTNEAWGEMAAFYWSYNIALYLKAREIEQDNLRSLEFNVMLENPLESVERCADWFGLQIKERVDPVYEMGELLSVYSKNTDYAYSPQQRRNEINGLIDANREHVNSARILAEKLLGDRFSSDMLPGSLI